MALNDMKSSFPPKLTTQQKKYLQYGFWLLGQWQRLNCLAGIVVLVLLLVLLSENKSKINWRPVIWGFAIQFCIGLFALQWEYGVVAFEFISEKIVAFLDFAQYGAAFTYGFLVNPPPICGMNAVFAFSVLQAILYFGAFVALLYQLGVMQLVLIKVAWLVQITLGTTATESLNAVASIFLGLSEAPLLIKPYLSQLTHSEVFAIMCAGFASVAGSLFAAYVSFGGHSQMMATYALCSFANIGSIGIQLGSVGSLSPKIKPILAKYALRAVATACIASFITTCWAGILISEPQICLSSAQSACFNVTVPR
ncbi:nucleoside transporter, NupC family [Trichinella nativa]|uniref:Nucleoside transporter, NupC family n=1 Tax=Trichinella nativa TaxID=6335 RepID=A0A1Y3EY76_9BILA|nr:nucleoside transporter, NupC family [Trichinella nativa]